MTTAAFIAADWGTSNARFALCDEHGRSLDMREGPGAAQSRGRFAEVFDDATAAWRGKHGELPAWMCGMVGSAFGWVEAPYLPCPEDLHELADSAVRIRDGVHVVPGMRCTNPLGAPDVMRGEETQLYGALCMGRLSGAGRQLVCMPGTHTKWVSLTGGVVQEFLTAPTGEIFGLLCEHSVLVRDKATPITHVAPDFERGLAEAARHPGAFLHQIFQARSLRLDQQLSAEGAASWTSGLLIGADVGGALAMFGIGDSAPVLVIGAPQLTESYAAALARRGREAVQIDGTHAALAGLSHIFQGAEARMNTARTVEMVAILRGLTPQRAPEVGAALVDAGFRCIEVPLNSPEPFDTIKLLAGAHGAQCLVGAGTVLTAAEVDRVHGAGGRLVVAPNCDPAVIRRALELGMRVMPGIATATEAFNALNSGATDLKLFPAATYGSRHLKALKSVLPKHVRIYPVGGIGSQDIADWLVSGADGFGFGSELFTPAYTLAELTKRARALIEALRAATG